ncbi:hypothetical protein EYY98_16755 [Obesumbacterium proteus]|nr:hypothetical protein EYY98_16755 [Obesumbacterium proteus]
MSCCSYCQSQHTVNFLDLRVILAADMEVVQVMIRTNISATTVAFHTIIASGNILRLHGAPLFRALRLPSYLSAFLAFSRCYSPLW